MVLGKFPPEKFPHGRFPPMKLRPEKFPPRKLPPGIFAPISLIVFLNSLFTKYFVHKWGKDVHVNAPRMKNFEMSRMAQCSHLRKIAMFSVN